MINWRATRFVYCNKYTDAVCFYTPFVSYFNFLLLTTLWPHRIHRSGCKWCLYYTYEHFDLKKNADWDTWEWSGLDYISIFAYFLCSYRSVRIHLERFSFFLCRTKSRKHLFPFEILREFSDYLNAVDSNSIAQTMCLIILLWVKRTLGGCDKWQWIISQRLFISISIYIVVRKLYQETGKKCVHCFNPHGSLIFFSLLNAYDVWLKSHHFFAGKLRHSPQWMAIEIEISTYVNKTEKIANSCLFSQYVRFRFVDTPIWTGVRLLALIIPKKRRAM